MSNFVHLHCHTEYSLLDGAIRLNDLCSKAKDLGMPAAAITDHGNMAGALNFYVESKKYGIKPILGCEVYVCNDHTDRTSAYSRVRHHLILLAKNNIGYHNLVKLVTHSDLKGFYTRPRVDKALLRKYSEGIIALSACVAGEIPRTLLGDNKLLSHGGTFDDAIQIANEYSSIYPNNFYLEVQSNSLPEQKRANDLLFELGAKTNLPLVATNDCHYLNKDDVEAHEILLCIQTGKTIHDPKRFKFDATDLYFKSGEEMEKDFSSTPEVLANTLRIADECHVEFDLKSHYFPVYDLPENVSLEQEFRRLTHEGLKHRLEVHPDRDTLDHKIYEERLEWELSVICEMGFPGYFLIVQDFINWAKDNDVPVGPGRGSAAGSLVAWALRITNLDPIPYNLLFERFLNNERVSLPDIDVDFCEDKRGEVIKYVARKYGNDHVAQITTFGKMKAKAVIRDVGRALDIPLAEVGKIAKLIPDQLGITINKALELEPELTKLYKTDDNILKLINISKRLEGLLRHSSIHAAGLVISDKPMAEYLPLYHAKGKDKDKEKNSDEKDMITQFDMKMVEKIGLVKFDFLGLRTMTLIDNTIKIIKEQGKDAPDLDTLPLTDTATYELYSRGDTDGVFQVESSGMRSYLRSLKPTCFEDIIAMLALYRPGPLKSGMVDEFIKRKHGEIDVSYPVPSLETCLKDTYGVIVYQEQVMQIAQIVAKYTLGGADLLRRAMGKKNADEMAKERSTFVSGATENGLPDKKANEIFDLMEKFAEYGFNKSHSAAYALISYHTAYLKQHFKVEFMAALLSSEIGNQDKILKYISSCRDMEIEVCQANVQVSLRNFIVRDSKIIYGLGGIKGVGDEAIKDIKRARDEDGEFKSFFDFCFRVNTRKVSKKVLECLIKAGACDCFGVTRAGLIAALDETVARAQKRQKDKQSAQVSMLGMIQAPPDENISGIGYTNEYENMSEFDEDQKLLFEKEALGFFLSSHPLQQYRQDIFRLGLSELEDARDSAGTIRSAVYVTSIKEIMTKRGKRMAFVGVEDLTASAEVTFFEDELLAAKEMLNSDAPLLLTAAIDNRNNDFSPSAFEENDEDNDEPEIKEIKLRATAVEYLTEAIDACDLPYYYKLEDINKLESNLEILKVLLDKHKGKSEFFMSFSLEGKECTVSFGHRHQVKPSTSLSSELKHLFA